MVANTGADPVDDMDVELPLPNVSALDGLEEDVSTNRGLFKSMV